VETELSDLEARYFLRSSDVWGTTRLYGIIGDGECAGQIAAIKSVHTLDKYTWSRLYTKSTTMADIVKPARRK
jgi:hypothetical protein